MNNRRKDLVLLGFMGALVVFAAFYFLIRPQRAERASIRDQRQSVEQTLSETRAVLTPAQASADEVATDNDALTDAVPAEPRLAELLRQLQAIGHDTGILQQSISPSPLAQNPSGPGGSLQISVTASGSHDAMSVYLQQIRDLPRLTIIEQIGVDSPQDDAVEHLQLSIRVFTQGAPIDVTAATP